MLICLKMQFPFNLTHADSDQPMFVKSACEVPFTFSSNSSETSNTSGILRVSYLVFAIASLNSVGFNLIAFQFEVESMRGEKSDSVTREACGARQIEYQTEVDVSIGFTLLLMMLI